jgi:hypothetical protein
MLPETFEMSAMYKTVEKSVMCETLEKNETYVTIGRSEMSESSIRVLFWLSLPDSLSFSVSFPVSFPVSLLVSRLAPYAHRGTIALPQKSSDDVTGETLKFAF